MKPTDLLNIWNALSRRWLFLLGALTVVVLYCAALYLQYVLRQDPCPLCMLQRLIFIAIGLLFFVAGLHHAKAFGAKVYAVLIALFSLGGVAAASRHIWLQNLPKDQVPACGPGLDYLLQNFPLADVWQELL
ncbi:MAG: disulfide bond formation protein B, partial [Pseudomonadota bacterium]